MEKILLKKFKPHVCVPQMKPVKVKETAKTRDNLVYTFADGAYSVFEVTDEHDDGSFRCVELNVEEKTFATCRSLNFGHVGIFKNRGYTTITKQLRQNDFAGKVVKVEDLFVTVPLNVLVER